MNPYAARKLAEFAASLLILIPCVLLLAWGPALPNVRALWSILLVCSGTFLAALLRAEQRRGPLTIRCLISKCGGFIMMFLFILYEVVVVFQ